MRLKFSFKIQEYLDDTKPSWIAWKNEYDRKSKQPISEKLEALKHFQGFLIKYQTEFASNNKEIVTTALPVNVTYNTANLFL